MAHIEILVEEPSAEEMLKNLLLKILNSDDTYRIHPHNGKDDLLRKLPNRLRGYKKMSFNGAIVVLIDQDGKDCMQIKSRLEQIATQAGLITKSNARGGKFQLLNRIAIEELEAWFFGDIRALVSAYPGVPESLHKKAGFRNPDAIRGGTWERLEKVLQKAGYYSAGLQKVSVAMNISQYMIPERNRSKSFQIFISGLKAIAK